MEGKYTHPTTAPPSKAGPIIIDLTFPDGYGAIPRTGVRAAPWYVTSCTLTITGANLPEPLVVPVPLDTGLVTGELMVGMYKFEVVITTTDPSLNFFGSETIPLTANVTNRISFELTVNAPPKIIRIDASNRAPARYQSLTAICEASDWDSQDVLSYWWTDNFGWRGNGPSILYRVEYAEPTTLTCHVSDGTATDTAEVFLDVLGLPKTINKLSAAGGDGLVSLSWEADSLAATYNIYWNATGAVTTADNVIKDVTGTTFSHTGLTNGQLYYYRVSGVNLSGEGPLSTEAMAFPSPPPAGVSVTAGFYELTLNWTGSPGATSYKIYWNTTGGVTTADNVIPLIPGTTYLHTGLLGNQTYYYRIAGTNVAGDTVLSAEAAGIPLPVVKATQVHNGAVLTWDAIPGATEYNLFYSTASPVTAGDASVPGLTTPTGVVRGLSSATTYYFAVAPVTGGAQGALTAGTPMIAAPKIGFTQIGLLPYGSIYHEATDFYHPATGTIISYIGYTTTFSNSVALSTHNGDETITNLPINPANNTPNTGYWARGDEWNGYAYFTNRNATYYAQITGAGNLGPWVSTVDAGAPYPFPSIWRTLHQTIAYGGRLYVMGGYPYGTEPCLKDIRYTSINANGSLNPWTVSASPLPWCTYRFGAAMSNGHLYFALSSMLQKAAINAATGDVGTFFPLSIMPPGFNAGNFDNSHHGMIIYQGYLMIPSNTALYILRIDPATGDSISWIDTIALPSFSDTRMFYVRGGNLYFAQRSGAGAVWRIDGLGVLALYP